MDVNHRQYLFRNLSIRYKLIIYFFMVISLPLFTLGYVANIIYSQTIEKEASNNTIMMISQVNQNVEAYVAKIENVMDLISKQPEIIQYMELSSMYDTGRINVETDARNRLAIIKDSYPEIAGVLVVNQHDQYISNELYRKNRIPLLNDEWYKLAVANPSAIQLINKPIDRNLSTSLAYSANDIVSISKAIIDPVTNQCTGVILIDLKIDTIKQIIESVKFGKSGFVYMADQNGNLIYTPTNNIVYRINNSWLNKEQSDQIVKTINGNQFQIIYNESEYTKWEIIGVFSLNEALGVVVLVRYYTLAIAGITFILAIMISLYFTASIVRPINKMKKLMKIVEGGNFHVVFGSELNDEIGQLGHGIDHMLSETNNLIKSKREAELRLLQSQIKPHFLYNTLDNIRWMAQEHKAQDIVDVVAALTTLFRHTIGKSGEVIQVKEELEHISSYLYIQKVRYEEKLNYTLEMADEILDLYMLRLTLQPLVENAIYHGIKEKRGNGMIRLTGKIVNERLYFCIKDNGSGIAQDKLEEINSMLKDKNTKHSQLGYGIYNVNERIRLTFGDEYGLKYFSIFGEETTVEVFYPVVKEVI